MVQHNVGYFVTLSIAVIIYRWVVLQFKTLIPALTWKGLVKSQKTLVRVVKCPEIQTTHLQIQDRSIPTELMYYVYVFFTVY